MFKKGQSGNPEGKKKGTQNKISKQVKEAITAALEGHLESIGEYIEAIDHPKDKLDAIAKLLPYIAPRLKSIEGTISTGNHAVSTYEIVPVSAYTVELNKKIQQYEHYFEQNGLSLE